MKINYSAIQGKYNQMISENGVWITWLQRIVSGSDAYNTGSNITFGYGDTTTFWITGSIQAIISHVSAKDVILEPGFYEEDYERIFVPADSQIAFWDRVIYPINSGIIYLVLPWHIWRAGPTGVAISASAIIRRLVPRSGSAY